jgi:molybdate/tungstate transport system permease protein
MAKQRAWAHAGAAVFAALLLYPLAGLWAPVGRWEWGGSAGAAAGAAIRVSVELTAVAMAVVIAVGTPAALYIRDRRGAARAWWQAALLISILIPSLALGILLTLALRPDAGLGAVLARLGMETSNSGASFVMTQVYVSIGYYVLGALVALEAVPRRLEQQAALLGLGPAAVFRRVTLPLARLGLAAALGFAWVRAIGEFGAVVITAYYPAGMPVQLWVDLESRGLPAVMPLLVAFLLAALPVPMLLHFMARRSLAGGRGDA